jgi:CRISPR-associated protein Csx17
MATVPLPGLAPESLGNYLASLGILRVLSRKWPSVRAAWHEGVFHIVGGPTRFEELLDAISEVAANREWSPYDRGWADAQKKSTKAKSGKHLALWQSFAEEQALELLAAHAVPAERVSFNPLLGSGGNAGKRDFAKGWKAAVDALAPPTAGMKRKVKNGEKSNRQTATDNKRGERRSHLRAWLLGEPMTWLLENLNAASWFGDANKLYNSGQRPFREGAISPWAMVFACEGLVFFAGGASRRLGARARSIGAFPFVTRGAAPEKSGEAERDRAEVWAPLWTRPMTIPEVRTLFARGRAEIQGRGVLTPSAFAVAIVGRGVDAGISEFRRFVLGRTTSDNTFESRFEGTVGIVESTRPASERATVFRQLLALLDQLRWVAESRNAPKSWVPLYVGPLEGAMLGAASAPDDPESAVGLLDAAVSALDRLDRNRAFRERKIAWQPLPLDWLLNLSDDNALSDEARLALSLVSGFKRDRPFALYRFGVTRALGGRFVHPASAPARWSWRPGQLPSVLCDVLYRSVLDWEADPSDERPPFVLSAACSHVERWLSGLVDDELVTRWASRLALFDWSFIPGSVKNLTDRNGPALGSSGAMCLYGIMQPFFDERPVSSLASSSQDVLSMESGARTPAVARTLASLVRTGQIDSAMRLAKTRYAMARSRLMETDVPFGISDPERLLASFLFSIPSFERSTLVGRWLRPQRKGEEAHA